MVTKVLQKKESVCHAGKNSPLICTYRENSLKLPLWSWTEFAALPEYIETQLIHISAPF